MTGINEQYYNASAGVLPKSMGGVSSASGTAGTSSPHSSDVYLEPGYIWSHVSLYVNGHGGGGSASASAVLKDGTSIPLGSRSGISGTTYTYYLANCLSPSQMAQLEHVHVYSSAYGASGACERDGTHHYCNGASVTVYGVALPWLDE